MVGPPQHPWKLVGPEHQGGEQQVPAALLALWRALILRASSPGQFAFQIETSLPAQLGTHHSRRGRVCGGGGGGGSGGGDGAFTTCCQDITLNLQPAQPKLSPVETVFKVTSAVQHRGEPARRRLAPAAVRALPDAPCCILGFTRSRRAPQPIRSRLSATDREARVREESPDSMQISALRNRLLHWTSVATEINDAFCLRCCCSFVQRFHCIGGRKGRQGCFLPFTRSPGIKMSPFLSSVRQRSECQLRKCPLRPPETPMRRLIRVAVCVPTTRCHQILHTGPRDEPVPLLLCT